jgi:hypothetical protein
MALILSNPLEECVHLLLLVTWECFRTFAHLGDLPKVLHAFSHHLNMFETTVFSQLNEIVEEVDFPSRRLPGSTELTMTLRLLRPAHK